MYLYTSGSDWIYPVSVDNEEDDGIQWHFLFSANKNTLRSNTTYQLKLKDNVLTDSQSKPVRLISSNSYTMIDTSCNGKPDYHQGYCMCDVGYGHITCDACAIGFGNVDDAGFNCQRKFGSLCFVDSCGCNPLITDYCQTIGKCNDSSGQIVCTCPPIYAGPRCDVCASKQSDNYAAGCPNAKTCSCAHGICDSVEKKCINCPPHWDGIQCERCASGWTGDFCDQARSESDSQDGHTETIAVFRALGIVIAVLAIVGTVGFLLYKKYRIKSGPGNAVLMLEMEQEDNSLVDEADLQPRDNQDD